MYKYLVRKLGTNIANIAVDYFTVSKLDMKEIFKIVLYRCVCGPEKVNIVVRNRDYDSSWFTLCTTTRGLPEVIKHKFFLDHIRDNKLVWLGPFWRHNRSYLNYDVGLITCEGDLRLKIDHPENPYRITGWKSAAYFEDCDIDLPIFSCINQSLS